MANLGFVDIETTGLDPDKHQVLEVAILTEPFGDQVHISLPINPGNASEQALETNGYYARRNELLEIQHTREEAAEIVRDALQGHVFIANNPSFDAAFLSRLLRDFGYGPSWHYHLVDIKSLVAGYFGVAPPWNTAKIAELANVPLPADAHTALADAQWNLAVYKSLGLEG